MKQMSYLCRRTSCSMLVLI